MNYIIIPYKFIKIRYRSHRQRQLNSALLYAFIEIVATLGGGRRTRFTPGMASY